MLKLVLERQPLAVVVAWVGADGVAQRALILRVLTTLDQRSSSVVI